MSRGVPDAPRRIDVVVALENMQIGTAETSEKRAAKFNSLLSRSKCQNNKFPCFPISRERKRGRESGRFPFSFIVPDTHKERTYTQGQLNIAQQRLVVLFRAEKCNSALHMRLIDTSSGGERKLHFRRDIRDVFRYNSREPRIDERDLWCALRRVQTFLRKRIRDASVLSLIANRNFDDASPPVSL